MKLLRLAPAPDRDGSKRNQAVLDEAVNDAEDTGRDGYGDPLGGYHERHHEAGDSGAGHGGEVQEASSRLWDREDTHPDIGTNPDRTDVIGLPSMNRPTRSRPRWSAARPARRTGASISGPLISLRLPLHPQLDLGRPIFESSPVLLWRQQAARTFSTKGPANCQQPPLFGSLS